MSGLPACANLFDRSGPLSVKEYERDCPDDELVLYRNHLHRSELYPNGVECLIHVPKAKLAELEKTGYFHGEVMNVRPVKDPS